MASVSWGKMCAGAYNHCHDGLVLQTHVHVCMDGLSPCNDEIFARSRTAIRGMLKWITFVSIARVLEKRNQEGA